MVSSRIEQKIEDIYAFVESCKPQALSQSKVVVPKNDLYDLLDDLRRDVPEEITRYQKMLSQRDAILEDAEAKADAIKLDAQEQYKAMGRGTCDHAGSISAGRRDGSACECRGTGDH